jgi:hypothetical protein
MLVDPIGLGAAAQRIMAALAQLPTTDAVHPTLAADPASRGAALRLSSAAATLAALLAELAAGLTATADMLAAVAESGGRGGVTDGDRFRAAGDVGSRRQAANAAAGADAGGRGVTRGARR